MFIIFVFWFGCGRPSGLFFLMPALLLSILVLLILPSSSVSLSYFILAVPMRYCLGKHSCMSSPFPKAILNGTIFFRSVKAMNNLKLSVIKQILLNFTMIFLPRQGDILSYLLMCIAGIGLCSQLLYKPSVITRYSIDGACWGGSCLRVCTPLCHDGNL